MAFEYIIVADPCPDNRESLAELLRLRGFAVGEADSLDTLLAMLRDAPADLVVTEFFGDPARTCSAVRGAAPEAMVVFHTTRGDPVDLRCSAALGCPHFIKASDTERLLTRLGAPCPRGGTTGAGWPGGETRAGWMCLA